MSIPRSVKGTVVGFCNPQSPPHDEALFHASPQHLPSSRSRRRPFLGHSRVLPFFLLAWCVVFCHILGEMPGNLPHFRGLVTSSPRHCVPVLDGYSRSLRPLSPCRGSSFLRAFCSSLRSPPSAMRSTSAALSSTILFSWPAARPRAPRPNLRRCAQIALFGRKDAAPSEQGNSLYLWPSDPSRFPESLIRHTSFSDIAWAESLRCLFLLPLQ